MEPFHYTLVLLIYPCSENVEHWEYCFPIGAIHKGRPHREGGGGSPKADIVREVAWIYSYRSSQNADKGGGGPKTRKFCGRPLCMVPDETERMHMGCRKRHLVASSLVQHLNDVARSMSSKATPIFRKLQ